MDDRVRIYELARRMNIPNQDIITGLRELGYDIKTHSSTVDANTVGLLIAHLGKKKQQNNKEAVATQMKKTTTAKPAAPPPPVVKPRVLSRYRPVTAPPLEATEEILTPLPTTVNQPIPVNPVLAEVALIADPIESIQIAKVAGEPAEFAEQSFSPLSLAPGNVGVTAADESASLAPASLLAKEGPIELPEEVKKIEELNEGPVIDAAPASIDNLNFAPPVAPVNGQSGKLVVPSVPIRIAAPSIRATPPRPPKVHRPSPSERHSPKREEKNRPAAAATLDVPKVISLTTSLTVEDLADKMGVAAAEVIKRLMMKNTARTINQTVELELAKELAVEMEYEISTAPIEADIAEPEEILSDEDKAALVTRPPVVTIMGHVDHGKTSLLDAIRQTKFLLTDAEAGGITQHIGAYHVEVPHEDGTMRQIVFLDTPGHEAFTAMRARGARATDIAILVVAADDGVMPQTVEAIDHVKAARVPIIVAVNKVDKAGSDPNRVLSQLMQYGLVPEALGGETVCVEVSAKKRTNLDQLLEMILLVADIEDLKANPDKPAEGVIIEAELSRGKGAVATALVENGTLREGDFIVAGSKSGRVRALFDDRGQRVKAAGPSMPVEVLGLDEVPLAGEKFEVVADSQASRVLVEKRKLAEGDRKSHHVSLESLHDMISTGEVRELNVIVKADMQGSAGAVADEIRKLTISEVQVRVLRTASGDISENDVNLAASSNAIIIGFNVQPDQNAMRVSEAAGVDIRTYSVIYQITDDLEKAIQGLIKPIRQEVQIGAAEIRQVFKFGKNLTIAGCMITSGKVTRGAVAKIIRNGQQVYEGKVETLKRFKDDAKEVAQGFECGMSFEKYNDMQEGDVVNAFVIQETKRDIVRA